MNKNKVLITFYMIFSFSFLSCSQQKKEILSVEKKESSEIYFNELRANINESATIFSAENNEVILNEQIDYTLEVGEIGKQIIKVSNDSRMTQPLNIVINTLSNGFNIENNCPLNLDRKQSCYLSIHINSNAISEGSSSVQEISINNSNIFLLYNVIASSSPTLEQEAQENLSIYPTEIDFGTLEVTNNEISIKNIQIINKSRKTLPTTILTNSLDSNFLVNNLCPLNLERGKACYLQLQLDSSSKDNLLIESSLSIANNSITVTAILNKKTNSEVLDDTLPKIDFNSSLDFGNVDNELKSMVLVLTNISRDTIILDIDDSNLNDFSISHNCGTSLARKRKCYINILIDGTSTFSELKNEILYIQEEEVSLTANILENGVENPLLSNIGEFSIMYDSIVSSSYYSYGPNGSVTSGIDHAYHFSKSISNVASPSEDFTLTFEFNKTGLADQWLIGFVTNDCSTTSCLSGDEQYRGYTGISLQQNGSTLNYYYNMLETDYVYSNIISYNSLPENNTLIISRVGTHLKMELNNNLIYDNTNASPQKVIPIVRTMEGIGVTSSKITLPTTNFTISDNPSAIYSIGNSIVDVTQNNEYWGVLSRSESFVSGDEYFIDFEIDENFSSYGDMIIGFSSANEQDIALPYLHSTGASIYLINSVGQYQLRRTAEQQLTSNLSFQAGDKFRIRRRFSTTFFYQNGELITSFPNAPNGIFYSEPTFIEVINQGIGKVKNLYIQDSTLINY